MTHEFFEIPAWNEGEADIVLADPAQPDGNCYTHFAYAVASPEQDWAGLARRRAFTFQELRAWPEYWTRFPELRGHLESGGYWPGQSVLRDAAARVDSHAWTAMRLGALELIANIGSGRIAANDKDPFPHQLQLQQFMQTNAGKVKRLLIADEVGLGKTIELGMIIRDLLVAEASLDNFSCVYFTSGGLVEDAVMKLRSVLRGAVGDQNIVQSVESLRAFGQATSNRGVHVASMHAARLLTGPAAKAKLVSGIAPRVVVVDECHHCASDNDLTGKGVSERTVTTKTYLAAHQLVSGTFWPDSKPPELVVFMSATPFRSADQFTNLLRLLLHGVDGIDAYGAEANQAALSAKLSAPAASIVWRRQDDPTVHSWRGKETKLFPNLRVVRPHRDPADCPKLAAASTAYLDIMSAIRTTVAATMRAHDTPFGGFAIAQLEKKLTSSSLAGACYLLSWCIRHSCWATQEDFKQDQSPGTTGIRELLRSISQRLAGFDKQNSARHADVYLASEDFLFDAKSISQAGTLVRIYELSTKVRGNDEPFVADREEVRALTELGKRLLSFSDPREQGETEGVQSSRRGTPGEAAPRELGVENAKLNWLQQMLERFPDSRFLIFTESLQTCTIITSALPKISQRLVGNMGDSERDAVVAQFRDPRKPVRVLVATSAADEGFDLQVANRVVHWDLSSSPAVLMQRNGRVARLGQVSDVTAYYLIVPGTHEERRDDALLDRFGDLGIDDERLRLRILGSLTDEEEDELERAIETSDTPMVGNILERAKRDNEEMADRLDKLRTELGEASALSRDDLAKRLERWHRLGLPDHVEFDIGFDHIEWQRPVFGETTHLEPATAVIAKVERGGTRRKFVFDPEYKVFGDTREAGEIALCGLRPWTVQRRSGRPPKHRPDAVVDLLGDLACSLARLQHADFSTIGSRRLSAALHSLTEARYLLFVTHPMLEAETHDVERPAPYLTFHAFNEQLVSISPTTGASAMETHALIEALEEEALEPQARTLSPERRLGAETVARRLLVWLKGRVRLGATSLFHAQAHYHLPVPVALIAVEPDA